MYLGSEFYAAAAEGCRLLGLRALFVTPHEEQVRRCLPDSVWRFHYLPFSKLMPHVGAIIHHGGRGTLSCANAAGIPQLILVMGVDRPDNAVRLQRLGVGSYLPTPGWTPNLVAAALSQLIGSSAVKRRCRELADRLRHCDAVATACDVIERNVAFSVTGSARAVRAGRAGDGR